MRQKQFEQHYEPLWQQLEQLREWSRSELLQEQQLPQLYRQLCQCLALALQRGYSPALTEYLQRQVQFWHGVLYGRAAARPHTLRRWLLHDLPQRVREEWRLLLLCLVAFYGLGLLIGLLVWRDPSLAYSMMDAADLRQLESMYARDISAGRGGDDADFQMFGFYIWNNVSICFRTFAGGVLFGVPALLSLTFNAMHLAVAASWLSRDGDTALNFWSFVIGHGSVELTGLVLAAMAGIRLGLSVVWPGQRSRRHSLQHASERMFPVLVGAAVMTVLAAFIEGFWSASGVPATVKLAVGGAGWLALIAFFIWGGRRG